MSHAIRDMFGAIADRYDRANQVLSMGVHHHWRRRAVKLSGAVAGLSVCDCATGTGDLAFAFKEAVGATGTVVGVDFAEPMISSARSKASKKNFDVDFRCGDVLDLEFDDNVFDISSIAFGIRNVDDPSQGLIEMARIVKPGGRVIVLEFGQPDGPVFGPLYRWYSRRIIPRVGGWLTGRTNPYQYLSDSAAAFPAGDEFVTLMQQTGRFRTVQCEPLTRKIAYIYIGVVA